MLDIAPARLRTHRNNIARYRRLLETKLSELEREYIQRRLLEEQSNLETLGSVDSAFN
jgi:predicted house-cleaning noncanonical NTP pyrophosphatase (MazG superfamily)